MKHENTTEQIIGCAYRIYNKMGFGFLESVYEKCMKIELARAGLEAIAQKPITVHYEGEIVGEFVADLVVEKQIIVELKSVRRIIQAHEIQLVNYLVATHIDVGLILNFGEQKVEVKRKLRKLEWLINKMTIPYILSNSRRLVAPLLRCLIRARCCSTMLD